MAFSEQRQLALDKKLNQAMAILLPLVEAGGIAYGTYVVIYLVCVRYLIDPDRSIAPRIEPRRPIGTALIVLYCLLLLVLAIAFVRLLQVIWVNPDVVPLGDISSEKHTASTKRFDRLDAYICDYQGFPLWCDKCHNWKPDRTHHSSQLGRCVRRMDHFCPYAGGVISESSHKFFVQFLFYASLYTGFCLIVIAVFLAERSKRDLSTPATWIVAVALAGLFFMFTFGMFVTTFYNMAVNYTTIEIMQKGSVYNIALLGKTPTPSTSSSSQSNILCEVQRSQSRSYIVCQTQPGDNPWDMGTRKNLQSIMGNSIIDWFLPFKMSPCTANTDSTGEYGWGEVVVRMMDEHGAGSFYGGLRRSRRRRSSKSEATRP